MTLLFGRVFFFCPCTLCFCSPLLSFVVHTYSHHPLAGRSTLPTRAWGPRVVELVWRYCSASGFKRGLAMRSDGVRVRSLVGRCGRMRGCYLRCKRSSWILPLLSYSFFSFSSSPLHLIHFTFLRPPRLNVLRPSPPMPTRPCNISSRLHTSFHL